MNFSFDDVKAVLFVVSLIGFNQVMFEDPETLRLSEALTLFEQVVANPAFIESTVILALNKKDLFEVCQTLVILFNSFHIFLFVCLFVCLSFFSC